MGFPDQFGWIQSLGSSQSICFAGGSWRIYNNFPFITKLASGWTNPSEKYARQIGSYPQIGMKITKIGVATTQKNLDVRLFDAWNKFFKHLPNGGETWCGWNLKITHV